MAAAGVSVRLSIIALFLVSVVRGQSDDECGLCDPSSCPVPPSNCLAGLVSDSCDCCKVCGKTEGQLCDHPDLPTSVKAGKCGDHLECRLRDDLDKKASPQATCSCRLAGVVCGSNGVTYKSTCRLLEKAIELHQKITVQTLGPCYSAPIITTPPENAKNTTKGTVTLACEASGYPIPTFEWTWTRVDGKMEFLPSDDHRISINTRGGPERWQATGWLQILELSKDHEGDYTCLAHNINGTASAQARVKVVNVIPTVIESAGKPAAGKPAAGKPIVDESVVGKPIGDELVADEPLVANVTSLEEQAKKITKNIETKESDKSIVNNLLEQQ